MILRVYGIKPWEMLQLRQGELKQIHKDLDRMDGGEA